MREHFPQPEEIPEENKTTPRKTVKEKALEGIKRTILVGMLAFTECGADIEKPSSSVTVTVEQEPIVDSPEAFMYREDVRVYPPRMEVEASENYKKVIRMIDGFSKEDLRTVSLSPSDVAQVKKIIHHAFVQDKKTGESMMVFNPNLLLGGLHVYFAYDDAVWSLKKEAGKDRFVLSKEQAAAAIQEGLRRFTMLTSVETTMESRKEKANMICRPFLIREFTFEGVTKRSAGGVYLRHQKRYNGSLGNYIRVDAGKLPKMNVGLNPVEFKLSLPPKLAYRVNSKSLSAVVQHELVHLFSFLPHFPKTQPDIMYAAFNISLRLPPPSGIPGRPPQSISPFTENINDLKVLRSVDEKTVQVVFNGKPIDKIEGDSDSFKFIGLQKLMAQKAYGGLSYSTVAGQGGV